MPSKQTKDRYPIQAMLLISREDAVHTRFKQHADLRRQSCMRDGDGAARRTTSALEPLPSRGSSEVVDFEF